MKEKRQEIEKWDRIYADQEPIEEDPTLHAFNHELTGEILRLLPEGGSTIEVGSGGGWQSLSLAQTGKFQVTLLDFSAEAIRFSQQLFARYNQTASFLNQDGFSQGLPEYDLSFNAGVLEHYEFEEQVTLVKAMASRSRNYVLVLVPNKLCYWYWIWRNQAVKRSEWSFGKEVPVANLSKVFKAAGLTFLGQKFLGHAWTESFIANTPGMDKSLADDIIALHRSKVLLPEHTGYLIAGLASKNEDAGLSAGWQIAEHGQDQPVAELSSALADLVAQQVQIESKYNGLVRATRLNYEKEIQALTVNFTGQVNDLKRKNIELQQAINSARNEVKEIRSSRTFRAVQSIWKLRIALAPANSPQEKISRSVLRKLHRTGSALPINPAAKSNQLPDFIDRHLTSASQKRVLLITKIFFNPQGNDMQFGGAERYLLELARLIREMNYEPVIVQCGNDYWLRYYASTPVIGVRVGYDYDALIDQLEKLAPSAALAIFSPFELTSNKLGMPAVGISHGIYWDDEQFQQTPEKLIQLINRIKGKVALLNTLVSVDTNTINWLRTVNLGDAQKSVYVPNFVDLDQFASSGRQANGSQITLLFPRRLVHQRGFWLVHQVIRDILNSYPNVTIHFVGKAAPEEQQAVNDLMLEFPDQVLWYFLAPEKMHEAYQKADITLIPTTQSEGTSLSCLEALASGNAVIATNVGGLPDLILHRYNGLLIQPNPDELKAAICELVENAELRQRLAETGQQVVRAFSIERWHAEWKRTLEKYLPARDPEPAAPAKPFIVFPFGYGIHWHGVQQRPHHLASQFVRHGYEVYWYTPEGRLPDPQPGLHLLAQFDDLYVERPVLIIYYPQSYDEIERYIDPLIVYDILDDISIHDTSGSDVSAQHARECHEQLLKKADIVLASSRELIEQIKPRRPDVIYVPNGVDVDHFDPRKFAVKARSGVPVIGYHGAIATWFDGELLARVASLRPDYHFRLIGPLSDPDCERALKSQPNIELLGALPYESLPEQIARFDVGIMPFKISPLTHAVRPLKILEYLAMKKPVVATPMKEILDWPGVTTAGDAGQFALLLDTALAKGFNDDGRIQAFVQSSTWEDVIQPLLHQILQSLDRLTDER